MGKNTMNFQYDVQIEAIISAGMKLLREHLGVIETEIFISKVSRKGFDYTKWRENLYEDMNLKELLDHAVEATKDYVPPNGVKITNLYKTYYLW
jgi:hypothetical protein